MVATPISRATFAAAIDSGQQAALQSVIQQLTIAPGGHTGWHSHPGGTVINVDSGRFTIFNDTCMQADFFAGQGTFEMGGHTQIARNEGTEPLVLTVIYLDVPVGGPVRSNVPIPACAGVGNDLPTTNAGSGVTFAVPPSGEIARSTFVAGASVDAAANRDLVIQQQTYPALAHSGWHSHPGATVLYIESGTLSFYMADCTKQTLTAGQGLIEPPNMTALARNEGTVPVVLRVAFFDVPVAGSPRIDQPEPSTCTGLAGVPAPSAAALPNTAADVAGTSSTAPALAAMLVAMTALSGLTLAVARRRAR